MNCARCSGRVSVPFDDIVYNTIICWSCYKIRENEQDYQDRIKEIHNDAILLRGEKI
jgi:hypothetical protein